MSELTDRIDSILRLLRQGIDVSTLNTEDVIDTLLRDLRAEISATAAERNSAEVFLDAANADVARLTAERDAANVALGDWRAQPTTFHKPTGDSLIDRLRGIYTIPGAETAGPLEGQFVYTRRFGVGAINHEAADRIEQLKIYAARLAADKERLDWIDMSPMSPEAIVRRWLEHGVGYTVRRAIDDARESAG